MEKRVHWYIPVHYAADLLGCHWRQVHKLIEQGILDFIRMPHNKIKVSKTSVERYLSMSS